MEKRLLLFFVLAVAILVANNFVISWLYPRKPRPLAQQPALAQKQSDKEIRMAGDAQKSVAAEGTSEPATVEPAATDKEEDKQKNEADVQDEALQPQRPQAADQRITIGSADEASPYRLLVTLLNRGAAVERIELNSAHHTNQEDDSGYLGHLAAIDPPNQPGALVGVVGTGTPAGIAGLSAGDIITEVGGTQITSAEGLERAIAKTRPKETLEIKFQRGGEVKSTQAKLRRRPMEVVRPDRLEQLLKYWEPVGPDVMAPPPWNVPSFRLTLEQVDDRKLGEAGGELSGVDLEEGAWEIMPGATESKAEFRQVLDQFGLEVVKRYELAKAEGANAAPAYHLNLTVEIRSRAEKPRKVAYRLYGPNGLPTEGWWYASKISRNWGGAGPRDVVVGAFENGRVVPSLISTSAIASENGLEPRRGTPLSYIGVDAQYFSAVLIPKKSSPDQNWFYEWQPRVEGPVPKQKDKLRLANVSFRLTSTATTLASHEAISQTYTIFAGPKQPGLVDRYGLGNLIYYGWFGWVSRPMAMLLHAFYFVVRNYGVAIILLTVLVRSGMMPLSRKQVQSAQKMQELQPELKKLQEKYKNDMEARSRAQRELFLKHNYNPLGGCLLMFVQLPIFIGLYRALSVDLELRGASLLWEGAWCSNLAAPDKLFRWDGFLPSYLIGWLGPYCNLLPMLTIVLFIWQQKMFMPPATDEQTRMQQRMMQYMMVFIGVMFFKVPSGLCIYFIASSLWGLAERKLMPKPGAKPAEPSGSAGAGVVRLPPKPGGNGTRKPADRIKKQREKR